RPRRGSSSGRNDPPNSRARRRNPDKPAKRPRSPSRSPLSIAVSAVVLAPAACKPAMEVATGSPGCKALRSIIGVTVGRPKQEAAGQRQWDRRNEGVSWPGASDGSRGFALQYGLGTSAKGRDCGMCQATFHFWWINGRGEEGGGGTHADRFPYWSFTKTVIAICALKLQEAGSLDLDAPLQGARYTLRQLLNHTA